MVTYTPCSRKRCPNVYHGVHILAAPEHLQSRVAGVIWWNSLKTGSLVPYQSGFLLFLWGLCLTLPSLPPEFSSCTTTSFSSGADVSVLWDTPSASGLVEAWEASSGSLCLSSPSTDSNEWADELELPLWVAPLVAPSRASSSELLGGVRKLLMFSSGGCLTTGTKNSVSELDDEDVDSVLCLTGRVCRLPWCLRPLDWSSRKLRWLTGRSRLRCKVLTWPSPSSCLRTYTGRSWLGCDWTR